MSPRYLCGPLCVAAIAGTTIADPDDGPAIKGHRGNAISSPTVELPAGGGVVSQMVYEVTHPADAPATGTRGTGGSPAVFNDGTFRSGLSYPLAVNAFDFGAVAFGPEVIGNFDWQCTFYDNVDPGSTTCAFYSGVLGTVRVSNIHPFWGFSFWGKTDFPGNGPGGFHQVLTSGGQPTTINFPDDSFGYEIRILQAGTNLLWEGNPSISSVSMIVPLARGPGLPPTIGSSSPAYWRNDSNLQGTPEYGDICVANSTGSAGSRRDIYLKLAADLPPPAPPANVTNLGTLDCNASGGGTVSRTVTLSEASFEWLKFSVAGSGVNVPSLTYCDISTTGDGLVDTSIALFDHNGTRIGTDDDGGDGLYSALTFGHGRRPGIGDSIQFDGNNGDLPPGDYYLAVGGFGTAFGGSGFVVDASQSIEAGDVQVNVVHNAGTPGCPLPPPIAPSASDLGLLSPGVTTSTVEVLFHTVMWFSFTIDYSIGPADTTKFLDINTSGSDITVDPEIGLYDSLGNAASANWNDDNSGDGFQAQLSFGDPGVIRPGFGDGLPATGQNGSTLAAGTYYLAVGLSDSLADVEFGPTGWQARSNSGSDVNVTINFRTPAGCRADFNGDGNVDPDDLGDYITCFFGEAATAGTCPAADFNQDGDINPDDLGDFITLYFGVAAGGPCI